MTENWPNSKGFNSWNEQHTPIPLTLTGKIPSYAQGTLYRTAPLGTTLQIPGSSKTYSTLHWFDAFASIHRFSIEPSPDSPDNETIVLYSSRSTCDSILAEIRATGEIPNSFSFGQKRDPCKSYFSKFLALFRSRLDLRATKPDGVNVNVTISIDPPGLPKNDSAKDGAVKSLYTKTDANVLQRIDPDTLEPIGVTNQSALHPLLTGPMAAAHARICPFTGDVFNYNLTFGPSPFYHVFRVSAKTGETTILATLKDAPAAYIHSFWLTEKYVVLCIYSGRFTMGGVKMLWTKNLMECLEDFDPENVKAIWYVIPREGGGKVTRIKGEGFFAFHSTNSYDVQEDGKDVIMAEVITYNSLDVLKKFYLANLFGDEELARQSINKGRGEMVRFKIDLAKETVERVGSLGKGMACELQMINARFGGKKHRYIYAVLNRGKSTLFDGLGKFDGENLDEDVVVWEEEGCTPGEAVFVEDPESGEDEEDRGVLLSVVLDGRNGRSFLLCLDAKTMKEMGRATLGEGKAMGLGFHGAFVVGGKGRIET